MTSQPSVGPAASAARRGRTWARATAGLAAAGIAGGVYATLIEREWFALRRVTAPVLAPGAAPLTVLHLSDLHMLPRHGRKARWVGALDRLEPDLVVVTGDTMSSADSIGPALGAFGRLLDRPGAFVYGNNDFYEPEPRSPHRYFTRRTHVAREIDLPWRDLGRAFEGRGWVDLDNARASITVGRTPGGRTAGALADGGRGADDPSVAGGTTGGREVGGAAGGRAGGADRDTAPRVIALAGVNDPHTGRDRYDLIGGPANAEAAVRIGVTHSPEPRVLDSFARDGYDLVLAGHTHGGQIRIPGIGAIVTNCGIDRSRARGLSRWGASMWLNVSAGLGNSPYMPVRFGCRPEATLLTLVARGA